MTISSDFRSLFKKTTTSYKYLFLKSVLTRASNGEATLKLNEIITDILVYAWYPSQFFKLSFGPQDKIASIFKEQSFEYTSSLSITSPHFENKLREELLACIDQTSINRLTTYVQFRILHPFFDEELRGKPDHKKNNMIRELATTKYEVRKPLYRIESDKASIVLHPDWLLYIRSHSYLLLQYLEFQWVDYLQKNNPNVPAIIYKTSPPQNRDSMSNQKKYWQEYIEASPGAECIYSGDKLIPSDLSIDHFLPWSYVCHNRIWNLIPTIKQVNSSKNNSLPDLNRYLAPFTENQYRALYYHSRYNSSWEAIASEVTLDLGLNSKDELLDDVKFEQHLKNTLLSQYEVANQLGFSENWYFPRQTK